MKMKRESATTCQRKKMYPSFLLKYLLLTADLASERRFLFFSFAILLAHVLYLTGNVLVEINSLLRTSGHFGGDPWWTAQIAHQRSGLKRVMARRRSGEKGE